MALSTLQNEVENVSGVKLKLKINDNRSTMLSVRWEPDCTRVSLHRMFLEAPKNIMQSLACYIRQEHKIISRDIKIFIEDGLKKLDYSHTVDQSKLTCQGDVYNLKDLYDELNDKYFKGKLNLFITWFGKPTQRNKSRVTFGLYHDQLKLIKINRLLDNSTIPRYVIAYVVFHEMLHHICPSYVDEKGLHRIHSKEFKTKEERFEDFDLAQQWIKNHQAELFADLD
jgi:predicted metal-dependent hydrolase